MHPKKFAARKHVCLCVHANTAPKDGSGSGSPRVITRLAVPVNPTGSLKRASMSVANQNAVSATKLNDFALRLIPQSFSNLALGQTLCTTSCTGDLRKPFHCLSPMKIELQICVRNAGSTYRPVPRRVCGLLPSSSLPCAWRCTTCGRRDLRSRRYGRRRTGP